MYKHFGKAVVRTPLFSYSDLMPSGQVAAFDFNLLLAGKLHDPYFMEALYWASPDIYFLANDLKEGHIPEGKKKEKLLHSLKKYIIRAGSRCTPYGLFAGCSVVHIHQPDGFENEKKAAIIKRKVRLDTGVLAELIDHIKHDPLISPYLHYRINTSLYRVHGTYRYMEYLLKDGLREYQLSSITQSAILDTILETAQNGMISIESISHLIGDETEGAEKLAFTEELIQSQFLVSELEMEVTGDDQLRKLKSQLRVLELQTAAAGKYLLLIDHIETLITRFEAAEIGVIPFREIDHLKEQFALLEIPVKTALLLHVDLLKPVVTDNVLSDDTISQLWKATSVLSMFSARVSFHEEQLKRFKQTFIEKYDTQEIPFSEVSDMEMGIGFPVSGHIGNIAHNPFTENLKSSISSPEKKDTNRYKWHEFLHKRASGIKPSDRDGLVLADEDLHPFRDKTEQLANTISLLFSVLPDGKLLLKSAGGATANNLLGRFAYMDAEMDELCKRISESDLSYSKDAVFAEIAHLPEGRIGNVIRRPHLSDYEIPFMATSGLDIENQIPIDDLMVSIHFDEVILRSRKLNKRVIPRLSCAHNYTTSELSVYQLLCALQHQGKIGFQISWGDWAKEQRFIPRLSYKKVILQLASWYFKSEDYAFILVDRDPLSALKQFLISWEMPKYIAISEGDHELVFDTGTEDYLLVLLEELNKKKPLKFIEWLHFDPEQQQNGTASVNQFILPLYRAAENTQTHTYSGAVPDHTVTRIYPPGSEWVYFKLYCGAHLSDLVLSSAIGGLSDSLLSDQLIDQFFFIRYTDPHYHIRYRIHIPPAKMHQLGEVMSRVYEQLQPYIADRIIWKVQLDTYQRELERYGAGGILETEHLFFEDSRLYLQILNDDSFAGDENLRLLTALKNIDKWLDLFKFSLAEKIIFTEQLSNALIKEFGNDCKTKVDQQYREMKQEVKIMMTGTLFDEFFNVRGKKSANLSKENLASYIHMSTNRWFKAEQRLMEYISYSFCNKYYKTIHHYNPLK